MVTSNSHSDYEINGKKVSQDEVMSKLEKKGVDLKNNRYSSKSSFLILQGEVESISQMAPKSNNSDKPGLLEYLEDLIGSDQFKKEIDEMELKQNSLAQEKVSRFEKLKASEDQLLSLEETKNVAIKYSQLVVM